MPKSSKRARPNNWYGEWQPRNNNANQEPIGGGSSGGYNFDYSGGDQSYDDQSYGYGSGYGNGGYDYSSQEQQSYDFTQDYGQQGGYAQQAGYQTPGYGGIGSRGYQPYGYGNRGGVHAGGRGGAGSWMYAQANYGYGYGQGRGAQAGGSRYGEYGYGAAQNTGYAADRLAGYDPYAWGAGAGAAPSVPTPGYVPNFEWEEWFPEDFEKYCPMCDATCTGEEPWRAHIEGAKHQRKKARYYGIELPEKPKVKQPKPEVNEEELDEIDRPKKIVPEGEKGTIGLQCELCKVTCQDWGVYLIHIKGTKHLKKKQKTALWGLGAEKDTCAICRIDLEKPCLKCENAKTEDECSVLGGTCSHSVHDCCMKIWEHNTKCPVCDEAWKVAKKTQFCARSAIDTA